jgi:serine protease AprX
VATADTDLWDDRVHCVLGALASMKIDADDTMLRQAVAARFASRFGSEDRLYKGDRPQWHQFVDDAVKRLLDQKVVSRRTPRATKAKAAETADPPVAALRLTASGKRGVDGACERALEQTERALPTTPSTGQAPDQDPVLGGVLTPPLREKFVQNADTEAQLLQAGLAQPEPEPIMIELNLGFRPGVAEAVQRVLFLWRLVGGAGEPIELADQYLAGELSTSQLEGIVAADAAAGDWPKRAIYRIWPDFEVHPQIDASGATIKARAAQRTFESSPNSVCRTTAGSSSGRRPARRVEGACVYPVRIRPESDSNQGERAVAPRRCEDRNQLYRNPATNRQLRRAPAVRQA